MPLHADTVVKAFVEFGNVKVEYKEFYEFNVLKSGKHFSGISGSRFNSFKVAVRRNLCVISHKTEFLSLPTTTSYYVTARD